MCINDQQEYDPDVANALQSHSHDLADSDTPTEPDTDTEQENARSASVWTGQYIFDLSIKVTKPLIGWVAGKGRPEDPLAHDDVELFLTSSLERREGVRGRHARFNFNQGTGFFGVARASRAVMELTVNGEPVSHSIFAFNQSHAKLRIGYLEYHFEYTEYARSTHISNNMRDYLENALAFQSQPPPYLATTPASSAIIVGQWTISSSLGSGSFGKVHAATNTKNEVVAIKTVVRQSQRTGAALQHEIQVLRALTDLGQAADDSGRLLRLREVIYQTGKWKYQPPHFENVWLVLEPVARETFTQLVPKVSQAVMSVDCMHLFREALRGVEFLHSHGWIHGDLKPANIGVRSRDPPCVVLLDLGGALNTASGLIHPTPGVGGTVGYLAPEKELQPYDASVDMWSLGVIGYQLIYSKHLWMLGRNPWRQDYMKELRPRFDAMYSEAIAKLTKSEAGFMKNLLVQMLQYRWTAQNPGHRISARDALEHACWQSLEGDSQLPKRVARVADA
ncbi:hypothetical protein MMC16_007770 [Acarospora aff. strigata]|nr:hypothetical protein [Acarospora aff. strigata]